MSVSIHICICVCICRCAYLMGLVNGSATRLVYHQCNPQLANIPTIFSLYMLDKKYNYLCSIYI